MNHETCIEILGRKLHMGHKIGVHLLGFIVLLKPNLKEFKYCIWDSFQLINHKLKPNHFKHGGLKLMRVLHFWIGLSPNHLQLD